MPRKMDEVERSPLRPLTPEEMEAMRAAQISRRRFLQRSGGIAAVTVGGGAGVALGSGATALQEAEPHEPSPYPYEFDGVPDTPDEPPPVEFRTFSAEEAAVVAALTGRMIPGTPDDPGARQAGVVYYIDFILSTNSGIHEPTYTKWPYARTYTGDTPPSENDDETIWVAADQIHRYGYQSKVSPLESYKIAIPLVQQHAKQKYGKPVQELSDEQQDQIIWDLLNEDMEGWEKFSPRAFFHTLRRHTAEGMFSDPAYGGNREFIGWKLVGFPGSQRGYAPEELLTTDEPRAPQSMHELPPFNPGVRLPDDNPNVIQPVREDEEKRHHNQAG